MSFCLRRWFAASLLLLALPAWSQQRLTLTDALRLAQARSQQLVAVDAAAAAANEMAVALPASCPIRCSRLVSTTFPSAAPIASACRESS